MTQPLLRLHTLTNYLLALTDQRSLFVLNLVRIDHIIIFPVQLILIVAVCKSLVFQIDGERIAQEVTESNGCERKSG